MKRSFLEGLFKDLETEDSVKKSIIDSIMTENGNDINAEKTKTVAVENDLKIKNEDDEVIMRAKLADDRKSFKVKSIAGDIFGILKNIEFTRQS